MATQPPIDWDADVMTTPAEEYAALLRSLRWTKSFGLFFVRCSPVKGQELIRDLPRDLPQKKFAAIALQERIDNLYPLIEALPDREQLDVVIVSGLEASLVDYIKPGYGGDGYYYKLDSVPRILGSLNMQRERFRDELDLCIVFLLPLFALKYFIRRAPDFFDWRSGTFEFLDGKEHLAAKVQKTLDERQTLAQFSSLSPEERRRKFMDIQELLDSGQHSPEQTAQLLFECALLLDTGNDPEAALPFYGQALKFDPKLAKAWYNRGVVLYELGRYEEAIADYKQAIAIQPDKFEAWHARGLALRKLGQYQEAIANYDHAIALQPDFHKAYYDRGLSLWALGDLPAALGSFTKTLEVCGDYGPALYNSACVYALLNDPDTALDFLERAVAIAPEKYVRMLGKDEDLKVLHRDRRFQVLLNSKK